MRSFRGMGKNAETPTKADVGKLKRDVCAVEGDCFLFREPRADCTAGYYTSPPARVGNGSFTAGARLEFRGGYCFSARGAGERSSPGMRVSAAPTGGKVGAGENGSLAHW